MTTLPDLLEDLDAEFEALWEVVADFADDDRRWDLPTPAEGWAVRDQIGHLAFFDDAGRLAMVDPDAFMRSVDQLLSLPDPMDVHLVPGRAMGGDELLTWWHGAHRAMIDVFSTADPSTRVPWYGPPMGMLSFVSARLMETWAHGQDVCDALGATRVPTARLRHVAHLGVRARPFSYLVRGREVPEGRIEVVLVGPDGDHWRWEIGSEAGSNASNASNASAGSAGSVDGAPASVAGSALDFCLVVTQRRNVADTDLVVTGALAEDWIAIAQAFAGGPGPGRPPA
jgi:uncharacterized protein (TIGR03084 family)